ncbi:MAG: cob(I)yrinic acid a,c-diamide adenosyltransferase [Spirochaetes bacterium]|nr:cob(I)yrinic acid a,c-diamide adenosyltransferase [Spirochaetota bacterium]
MSITTKTGDDGTTSLWSGERVSKDDARVEAYGTIDELSSFLAFASHAAKLPATAEAIREIIGDLFRAAGELASAGKPFRTPIVDGDVSRLERRVGSLEDAMRLKGFVLPGATESSARLDIARAVARRTERRVISLSGSAGLGRPVRLYLNRLSDLLFLMARAEEAAEGAVRYL